MKMKKIIAILILTTATISCKPQEIVNINTFNQGDNSGKYFKDIDNHFTPFLGTWENTTGILTFRVILYKTAKNPRGYPTEYYMDDIEGRFLLIENVGTLNETIIHDSVKYYPQSDQTSENVIIGGAGDGITMGASIQDNSVDENVMGILPGSLTMEILNTGSTPLQAQWSVEKGVHIVGFEFNIPTDIVLTKQ